jgi:hypothetical protein
MTALPKPDVDPGSTSPPAFTADRWQHEGPTPRRIAECNGGLFEHHPEGFEALCLPVHDIDGDAIDIVAWQDGAPARWWLWRGAATVLGERAVWQSGLHGKPVKLVGTPADWIGADPMTACVLDWTANPRRIFAEAHSIEAPPKLAKRLRDSVAARCRLPIRETP